MIFHSLDFLLFFIVVLAAYWAMAFRWQNVFLLAASWFFYGYVSPWFLGPLIVATLTDFFVAQAIGRSLIHRKLWVWISLIVNLGMLGVFKYFNFFIENVNGILTGFGLNGMELGLSIILPVGISFYTLQSIGYTIDVYRGHIQPCRRFVDYALYVAFFPQLVAGPIERSTHLLPMIGSPRTIDSARILSGLQLMLWGFFKKLVIADNVAITANKVFALESPDGALLWAGVFAFAIQIFADFSAYTDIARGAARILGFELMENFRGPYLSQTPHEFWGRWHISLSSWIRDYVYIPLGGSRCGPSRNVVNIIIAFAISGLWHGAQWNFLLWGLYWSLLTLGYRALGIRSTEPGASLTATLRIPVKITMLFVLTCFGWLIFRETNPHYLVRYLTTNPFAVSYEQAQVAMFLVLHTATFALPLLAYDIFSRLPRGILGRWEAALVPRRLIELAVACALFFTILILRSQTQSEFIYFQF